MSAHAPVSIRLIFRNAGAFTHTQSGGGFAWVDPNPAEGSAINDTTQNDWPNGSEVDNFYTTAECSRPGGTCAGKLVFGIGKKGFDREDAPFQSIGLGHVTSQQCGQVWLKSFAEPSLIGAFNTTNQIPYMIAGTWDDYEEGTEIETGIDNCISAVTASVPNTATTNFAWTSSFSSSDGTPNTIDHFEVGTSTDGGSTVNIKTTLSPSSCTFPAGGPISCSVNLNAHNRRHIRIHHLRQNPIDYSCLQTLEFSLLLLHQT